MADKKWVWLNRAKPISFGAPGRAHSFEVTYPKNVEFRNPDFITCLPTNPSSAKKSIEFWNNYSPPPTASITNNQPWMLFPRPVFLEWDTTPNPMAKDLVKEPLVPTNGLLQVPDGIGIGVEVNEEAIKNYLLE